MIVLLSPELKNNLQTQFSLKIKEPLLVPPNGRGQSFNETFGWHSERLDS